MTSMNIYHTPANLEGGVQKVAAKMLNVRVALDGGGFPFSGNVPVFYFT